MSDAMLLGVLRMPPELWDESAIDVAQRHSRYLQAADEIVRLKKALSQAELHGFRLREIICELESEIRNLGRSQHQKYGGL